MDDYTQALLERTRLRREVLEKKMAEGPSPRRKRSNPLSEIQTENAQVNVDDDSPNKKRCIGASDIKPDTPAVRGVRSRMQQLTAHRSDWTDVDEARDVTTGPPRQASPEPKQAENVAVGRKARFAALAQDMGNWEEDMSRHAVKPVEKPKKVWVPPKAAEPSEQTNSSVQYKVWQPKGAAVTKSASPAKPVRMSPVNQSPARGASSPARGASSPARGAASPARGAASPARGTASPARSVASPARGAASPARSVASPARGTASPARGAASPAHASGQKSVVSQLTVQLSASRERAPNVQTGGGVKAVMRQKDGGDEPTARPVSARMAHWQKRIDETEAEKPDVIGVRPASVATTPSNVKVGTRPATTPGARPVTALTPKVAQGKVGAATNLLQSCLQTEADSWQTGAIAEETRKQRQAEMAVLEGRWKNGILADGATSTVPVAPPLPDNTASAAAPNTVTGKENSPQKSPMKSDKKRTPITQKREEGRNKLRSEFEDKLKVMGFDVQSETATLDLTPQRQKDKAKTPPVAAAAASTTPRVHVTETKHVTTTFKDDVRVSSNTIETTHFVPPVPKPVAAGHSILGLVKKQSSVRTPSAVNSTPSRTPLSRRDSFDSDDDDGDCGHQVTAQRSASFASTQSADSETQSTYSESQTDDCTSQTDDCTSQTDECTSQTDEYTSQTDDYTEADYSSEDETQSSHSEDEYDDDEIDGMLQDAMDEDEYVNPTPAPRHHKVQQQPHNTQVEKRVTFASSGQDEGTTGSSSENEHPTRPVVYSVDMYRASKCKKNTPTVTIVRQSEHQREVEREEEMPFMPEVSAKQRLQELHEQINQEQSVIMQTSNALTQCCGVNSMFARSTQAVECHRLLLMSCKKREMYLEETQRLRHGHQPQKTGPHGSLTISDISLPLKQNFHADRSADNHFFIVLIRHGTHVVFTQMVSTADSSSRSVDFPNLIKLSDIRQDFHIDVEVYSMYVVPEPQEPTPKKKRGTTPKKKFLSTLRGGAGTTSLQSPGGPMAVRSTNFHLLTSVVIDVSSLNKTQFSLNQVPFTSPLQGTMNMRLTCLMESCVEEQGFLTMFEDVCGFGAWHRRWCILRGYTLSFWKYPNDEKIKDAIGCIDLKQCITDVVGLVSREFCARPNTFELRTVRRQLRGESDTLVTQCHNTISMTKHWISADTKEDRIHWCDKLNQALHNIRVWHSDAMRPVKVAAKQ